jgi:hypothetical protein
MAGIGEQGKGMNTQSDNHFDYHKGEIQDDSNNKGPVDFLEVNVMMVMMVMMAMGMAVRM